MRYALLSALKADKKPLYLDGKNLGELQEFTIPRNVLVLRVPEGTSLLEQQRWSKVLRTTLRESVLMVDPRVEFLVLESPIGYFFRRIRERLKAFTSGLRTKFALFNQKS